jgi:hypothetical protein
MILAEKRGLLTPEQRALAWKKHDDRLLYGRRCDNEMSQKPTSNPASLCGDLVSVLVSDRLRITNPLKSKNLTSD